jgi:RNA polymerase sigma factor (sigma-70 family)
MRVRFYPLVGNREKMITVPLRDAVMPARPEQLAQHLCRLAASSAASPDADAVLLEQFIARQDEDSFAALVRRHGPMVLGVCRRILNDAQDAEDACQAAFLVLARKAASVKPRHALSAWLYGVARRLALKGRGVKARQTRLRRPLLLPPADPHPSPLDELSARELLAIFEEELQRLPATYRLPLILCCLEGRSQEEAAQQLGWTAGSVKGRLERGRARLHARLQRRGLTLVAALLAAEAARAGTPTVKADAAARAALRFVRGHAEGAAAMLAQGMLRGMTTIQVALAAGLLTAVLAVAGAGVVAHQLLPGDPPQAARQAEPPKATEDKPRPQRDRRGDPLPAGVIARLALDARTGPVIDLVLDASGRHVVSRAGEEVFAWRTRDGELLGRHALLPRGHEYEGPLLPGGYLLTGERTSNPLQGRFWIRDLRTGDEWMRFDGRPDVGPPSAVAAPGGRFVAVRGRAGEICVLDVAARRCLYRLDPKEAASGLKLSADGDVLVWYNRTDTGATVQVRRHQSGKTLTLRDLPKTDRWLWIFDRPPCVSPDGRWLVLSTEEGRLRRWDLTTGEEMLPLADALRTSWELCWSPDGRFLAVQGSASPSNVIDPEAQRDLRVWDVRTGERLAHLTVPNRQGGMHVLFTPDSRTLVTTDLQGVLHLWEVTTGQERATLRGHRPGEIGTLALRDDGRLLVSGGYDSQVLVWDLTGCMPDGQWHPVRQPPDKLRAAWEALAADDARAAFRAMWQLVGDAEGSTALLRQRLRPVPRPRSGQVTRCITALDAEDFATRERASRELEAMGEAAADDLRQTLTRKPTLEVRRRIEALLAKLEPLPAGGELQAPRGIEALEHIDTAEARNLLHDLALGAPGTRRTQEAQRAQARLEKTKP